MEASPNAATLWPPLQSAPLQALDALFQWIEDTLKVSSDALDKLKAKKAALRAMRTPPTLARAQANVDALQEVLHMTRARVRFVRKALTSTCLVCQTRRERCCFELNDCCLRHMGGTRCRASHSHCGRETLTIVLG